MFDIVVDLLEKLLTKFLKKLRQRHFFRLSGHSFAGYKLQLLCLNTQKIFLQ